MKSAWIAPLLVLPLVCSAADDAQKPPAHTTRLGQCSKEAHAKGLRGDDRKKFISACIASAKPAKPAARAATPAS